jgi:L-ascorbate metabolism protein UlaG (beta-lactamase superfamily)
MSWTGCGGFEVRSGRVNFAFDPYLFGDRLENAAPVFDYIFISHEHFDHCHPGTLRQLCRGDRIKKVFVSPGCCDPNKPVAEKYGDAAFDRDLPITKFLDPDLVEVVYSSYLSHVGGEDRVFPSKGTLDLGPVQVEVIESGENQRPDLPTCGYLVTIKDLDVSFLHPGDLIEPYKALEHLRGRVTYLIHMKMGVAEWGGEDKSDKLIQCLDAVQPEYVIPTHYRTDRESDPIPHGTWPPDATDVGAYIESIRETVGDRAKVLPFTAGVEYEVEMPSKRVLWKWNWHRTWDLPPWREAKMRSKTAKAFQVPRMIHEGRCKSVFSSVVKRNFTRSKHEAKYS